MRALALLLFCCSALAQAATIDPRLAKYDTCGRYELFSINGIMTDFDGATRNIRRIEAVYGNAYKEHLITYKIAFNQTRGFKTDFLDAARQVISGYAGITWDKWVQAVDFGVYNLGLSVATSQVISKKITDLFGFTKPSPYQDADLWAITNDIMTGTAGDGRRLLWCHSQGNLYCTLVYDQLIARGLAAKTIGVVGVAVPSNAVKTGNVYTTSLNDLIIDAVRAAAPLLPGFSVLGSTITIPYAPTVDIYGHKLVETYLANSAARTQIITNITNEFATLKSEAAAVTYPTYPSVTYANVIFNHCQNCIYWNGTAWVPAPDSYTYWTPAPYTQSQYIQVSPGSLSAAMTQAALNGAQCYSLMVAEIKRQRLLGNTGYVPSIPTFYGCWEGIGGNPAIDYSRGAWWLYSGDLPPVWRTWYDPQIGKVGAEGAARCTT